MSEVSTPNGRRGLMLVLSSPSGAGKSTIARNLLAQDRNLKLSVSVTTREKRPSEIDGVHYHFISKSRFEALRDHGDLLEWAEVHGNFYGTPAEGVDRHLADGFDVLFDIDWQGTQQLIARRREDLVTVFVLPPSADELRHRLVRRNEDDPDVIARRLANAKLELEHWVEYDYVIVNDDLDRAFHSAEAILAGARLRRDRRPDVGALVERIRAEL